MKTRILGLAALAALVATLTSAPASAQAGPTDTYSVASDATALVLAQGDPTQSENQVAFGVAHSEVSGATTPKALARGTGFLSPVQNAGESSAETSTDGETKGTTDETCAPTSLPADTLVLTLSTACSSSIASVKGGLPTAGATGSVASLGVAPSDLFKETPLGDAVIEPLRDGVNEIIGNLDPLFTGIDENFGTDTDGTLDALLDGILGPEAGDLVSATFGDTTADSVATDAKVTATSTAKGATITVLDRVPVAEGPDLPPILQIVVGSASSTVEVDRDTGKASGKFEPALVRIIVAPDILAGLPQQLIEALPLEGEDNNEIVVPVGQSACFLPAPLETCVTAANGAIETDQATGTVKVATSAVKIELLKGLEGGITLALADTSASGVGGITEVQPTPPPTTEPELPRTGGSPVGGAALAALFGLATLGLAATRRARAGV